jgi:rod shape-determining protein MreB
LYHWREENNHRMNWQFLSQLSRKIGIDLGTSYIRIWSDQDGVVVEEPSCLAIDTRLQKVIAVGKEAQEMVGRVHESIQVKYPIRAGQVTDPNLTEAMLRVFLQKIFQHSFFFRPSLMVSIPSGLTEPERLALTEMLFTLGVKEVNFIDQVLAAAIGAGVPIADASGSFLLQMGAGLTEAGIISLGSLVAVESFPKAGDFLDQEIQATLRQASSLQVGTKTAERVKNNLLTLVSGEKREMVISGQDVIEVAPKEVSVSSEIFQPVLRSVLQKYLTLTKKLFEHIPPELTNDLVDKGILLSGGLSQIPGIESFFVSSLGIPASRIDEPAQAVVKGIAQVLQNLELFRESAGYRHESVRNG